MGQEGDGAHAGFPVHGADLADRDRGSQDIHLSVVIPAFNEALRLVRTLDATAGFLESRAECYEILLVDDGSNDDTVAVAEQWARRTALERGSIRILSYERNRGKGYAVRYGILRARAVNHILYMDADLATPIEEIDLLSGALVEGIGVAIGSRPLAESHLLVRQPWYREVSGRLFNGAVQIAATPGIQDTQCGFKLLSADAARAIFSRAKLDGFSFDVEALLLARRLGFGIVEVPVRWSHQEGASAFGTAGAYVRHGIQMLQDLSRIRWAHRHVCPLTTPVGGHAAAIAAGVPE